MVHPNSTEPSKVGAHAYASRNAIYLAPGQERRLAHEAWHLIQQRQGRVAVTARVAGMAVNDDPRLESEADRMGERALGLGGASSISDLGVRGVGLGPGDAPYGQSWGSAVVQRDIIRNANGKLEKQGRVSGHDAAANKQALSGLIATRAAAGGNNDVEDGLRIQHQKKGGRIGRGGRADFLSGKLGRKYAICHKMSDDLVQRNIIIAGNLGSPLLVNKMIRAITPINVGFSYFNQIAKDHYEQASALFKSMKKMGLKSMDADDATRLAKLIANSPMNLFVGHQPINGSIGSKFDFNSRRLKPVKAGGKQKKPVLKRVMTPRSDQIDHEMGEQLTQTSSTPNGQFK